MISYFYQSNALQALYVVKSATVGEGQRHRRHRKRSSMFVSHGFDFDQPPDDPQCDTSSAQTAGAAQPAAGKIKHVIITLLVDRQ